MKPEFLPKPTLFKILFLSLAGLSLVWLNTPPAYAAAPPVCYPNTPLADLRLENSPLADHAYGDQLIDFDGDGKTDVFSTTPENGLHRWRFSAGARQPWQNLGRSGVDPANLRFGDFNGDGITDVFSIGPNHQWRYAPGGTGSWQPLFQDRLQTPLNELRFGDFNGDGKTDIFRIRKNSIRGEWDYSPGGLTAWQELNPFNMGTINLAYLRFGDFDGDGQTDVFSRLGDGQWHISFGGKTGWQIMFTNTDQTFLPDLRFGDFDGDGQTDVFRRKANGQWQYSPGAAAAWQDLGRSSVTLGNLRFGDFNGDGKTDVFSQAAGGKWRASLGGTTTWRIIFATVDVNGGLLSCLTGDSDANRSSSSPAISADGRKFVFDSDADFKGDGIQPGQSEIWLYDVAGSNLTRLTNSGLGKESYTPAISEDGSKIVFVSNSNFSGEDIQVKQTEIWLYDASAPGGNLIRLTTSGPDRESFNPAISENGSKIVFVSDAAFKGEDVQPRQFEIWLYDLNAPPGQKLTRLTTSGPDRDSVSPAISENGSKIVFHSDAAFKGEDIQPRQFEIWLYDRDAPPGQELTRLTNSGPDRRSLDPAISADGRKIVFHSDADFKDEGILEGQNEIWLYNLDALPGQELTRLTTASEQGRDSVSPAISADGRKIVFVSDADFKNEGIPHFQYEIWLYDVNVPGGNLTRLATTLSDEIIPAISADGSKIVFESDFNFLGLGILDNQHEIWLFEPDQALPPPGSGGGSGTVYLPIVLK